MSDNTVGKVIGIALRTGVEAPMREVSSAIAREGGGLDGDVKPAPHRGITFIASRQWDAVQRELGGDKPWHTRRANVLIEADRLGQLVGRRVRLGEVEVEINGETHPCGLMDELQPGLMTALNPDLRAGVHGQVLRGGTFAVGDALTVID